ncbi:MAG: TolC family protein [Rikenellaceae bacterium]
MMRSIFLILFVFAFASKGFGQTVWSMEDCMRYAVKNASDAQKNRVQRDIARDELTASSAQFFPTIGANVGTSTSFGRSIDPATNTYVNNTNFNNSYGISGNLTILDGLSLWNMRSINKIALMRGDAEQKRIEDNIALQTMASYIDVVYNYQMISISRQKLEESKLNLRFVTSQSEVGVKSSADVAQIEAEVALGELNLINQQNGLEKSVLKLKDWMNYPLNDDIKTDTIVNQSPIIDTSMTNEEIVAYALSELPTSKIASFQLDEAIRRRRIALGEFFPTIYANGGISTSYYKNINGAREAASFKNQFKNNMGEYFGVSMSIPIFGRLQAHNKYRRAKNNVTIAEIERDKTLRALDSEVKQAIMDMEGAQKALVQAEKGVLSQELAHKVNVEKYLNGMITIIELQTSSNKLLLARVDKLNSYMTYAVKCRAVNYYKGEPLIK